MPAAPGLPIDTLIPEALCALRSGQNLVIEAPPGAGKTTRVPPALLGLGGEVLTLEPRRLAARLAARRVAFELGERVGETVGYQVRFEEVAGPRTRLRFMTEGLLTRRLLGDPRLRGVRSVVLDEFHERHLEGDLALAMLRRLQQQARPDLRLVVMSATLDAGPVAAYLGGCPVLRAEGRRFELSIRYRPPGAEPLEQQVVAALETLCREGLDGDVLVFLPGAREIRRVQRALEPLARRGGWLVLPLHGDLSPEEQERAIAPAEWRKVILSTNVAESSVTIEGVTAVVDSGLARVASHSPWSGLPRLEVRRISQASADQRAGRAGRTAPGRVIRLYSAEDLMRRPRQEAPEILREELSRALLAIRALGAGPEDLDWLDAPSPGAWEAAGRLLERLGALDGRGTLTPIGAAMARMPLEPRLARLVVEADRRGVGDQGCAAAAVLSAELRLPETGEQSGPSDVLRLMEAPWTPRVRLLHEQIRRQAGVRAQGDADDRALLIAVLAAFPDRVARRRREDELLLAGGGAALLARSSVVRTAEFMVAVDVEERPEQGLPLVRLASAIEPEWLLELFPERMRERSLLEWNRTAERVERASALLYDELPVLESRAPASVADAEQLLVERALEAGVARFADSNEIEWFLARVEFASAWAPLPVLGPEDVAQALASLCRGLASFSELEAAARDGGLLRALAARLPEDGARALESVAPAKLRLPSGRQVRVNYARGRPPWIAGKIQEFFGLREAPRLAGGRAPLVVQLLAPNNRPVQMTADLAGFWERLYPALRRELGRRYPRHHWPEDPLSAAPSFR